MTRIVRALALATAALALLGTAAPVAASPRSAPPAHLDLPDGFQPEGIATRGPIAYLGSRADGDVYRLDLRTGAGRVLSQGPGTPSLGMKVDHRGRLFVAGGTGGDARVLDTRTGRVLASYDLTSASSFVNDVVLTCDAAWFTDSAQAQLYQLPLGRHGRLPAKAQTLPLTGDWQQVSGNNANGIARTPDGRALLTINSSSGLLYRVDPRTGVARVVDVGGVSLAAGDGLWLEGRSLYVVQNRANRIAVVHLDRTGTRGTVTSYLGSPDFDVPTTIARWGGAFYLPNARFTTTPTPTTAYWVTRLPVR